MHKSTAYSGTLSGRRGSRKFLVIESDDWGSIKMVSKSVYALLLRKGYPVDKNPYNRFDSLECNEDLEVLFESLSSVRDRNGNTALLTINNIVANPDFSGIKESEYQEYRYEPFTETLKRYPARDRIMALYYEGISAKLVKPQYHGREHLNIFRWMRDLRTGTKLLKEAVSHDMCTIHSEENTAFGTHYHAALDIDTLDQVSEHENILKEGIALFRSIWGYGSESFIAPCYIWRSEHEQILKNLGVKYIQGTTNQFAPIPRPGCKYETRYHYQGQTNAVGQVYLVRNVFFEPYKKPGFDWISDCLYRIGRAFNSGKPAIISTHRVNFIGSIVKQNRNENIKLFSQLLKRIVANWPDVEFLSSDELGRRMSCATDSDCKSGQSSRYADDTDSVLK